MVSPLFKKGIEGIGKAGSIYTKGMYLRFVGYVCVCACMCVCLYMYVACKLTPGVALLKSPAKATTFHSKYKIDNWCKAMSTWTYVRGMLW